MTAQLERALDDVRRRYAPDTRIEVFEVRPDGDSLGGATTIRDARDAVRRLAAEAGLRDDVRLLPDAALGEQAAVLVTAAVAPLVAEPRVSGARVTEALHGEALTLLERRDGWLRVRGADRYLGWTHAGYVAVGSSQWADDWSTRATDRSLGCELRTEAGRRRLPVGARLAPRRAGGVETADGAAGELVSGIVRSGGEARAEARLIAAPEWALRWFGGAPYLWGGRTDWGCDCSGLAQAVYAARGIALPRDADQQFAVGAEVPLDRVGHGYQAGDLLFFTEGGRVSHVALWAGSGRIVHSALSRGGVASDDLFGDEPLARRRRDHLVAVRRPDP